MLTFVSDSTKPLYGFHGDHRMTPDRMELQTEITRYSGKPSLKVTVLPGDNILMKIDPNTTGERNDLIQMMNANNDDVDNSHVGTTEYLAQSLFLPTSFKSPQGWGIPLQLHPPTGVPANMLSPVFEIDFSTNPGHYSINTRGGQTTNVIRRDSVGKNLNLGGFCLGKWADMVYAIKYATDNTGSIHVYRRIVGVDPEVKLIDAINNIPTLYADPTGKAYPHYFVMGFYRGITPGLTSVFYMGKLARATTMQEAVAAAFGG